MLLGNSNTEWMAKRCRSFLSAQKPWGQHGWLTLSYGSKVRVPLG